jgi:WD40 repeat protein
VTVIGEDGQQYNLAIHGDQTALVTNHLVDVVPSEFFPGHDISQWQPNGKLLASIAGGLLQKWVDVWDADSGATLTELVSSQEGLTEEVAFLLTNGQDQIDELAWSPDGLRLATAHPLAGCCGMVSIWDPTSGQRLNAWATGYVDHLAWSPDGLYLASGDGYHDAQIHIWNPQTGMLEASIGNTGIHVSDLAWSPDGSALAFVSSVEDVLVVWDLGSGQERFTLEGRFEALRWSPDSTQLLVERSDGRRPDDPGDESLDQPDTWLVDARPGFDLLTLPGGKGAAWSPDGERVITFSNVPHIYTIKEALQSRQTGDAARLALQDTVLENYNLSTYTAFDSIPVSWLPDGRLAASDRGISGIWELETGKAIPLPAEISNRFTVWNTDGSRLARIGETIEIYNPDGERLFDVPRARYPEFTFWENLAPIAWSPDGTRIASQEGAMIRLWDAITGEPIGTLAGHVEPVSDLSWSPDGKRLASTSGLLVIGSGGTLIYGDKTVRIWDVSTMREMYRLLTPMDAVITSAQWSPDGKYLLTTNPLDDVTRIWRAWASLEDLTAYARQCCAVRQFTAEELGRFGLEQ